MSKTKESPSPRYEIRHPTIVNGHFWGCEIRQGVGQTDDEAVVNACRDRGCAVTDRQAKPAKK
jgi:hypothetical protein